MIGFIPLTGDNNAKYYVRPNSIDSLNTATQGATAITQIVGNNEVRTLLVHEKPSEITELIVQCIKDELAANASLRRVEQNIEREYQPETQTVPEGDWPDGVHCVSSDDTPFQSMCKDEPEAPDEPEWLTRAKKERDELNEKITALTKFLNDSDRSVDLPEQEEKMLSYQLTAMREYSGVLQARLDLH